MWRNAYGNHAMWSSSGETTDITTRLTWARNVLVEWLMQDFDDHIAGQKEAKQAIIDTLLTGIFALRRDGALWAIFLGGPTGVWKTELVKAAAHILFGDSSGYTSIQGELLKHPIDVAILTGATPWYVGYGDTPRLSDTRLYSGYTRAKEWNTLHRLLQDNYNAQNLSIVLIDEAEKAHIEIVTSLLWAIQNGEMEMNFAGKSWWHSKITNLHNTLFIFTSNIWEATIAHQKGNSIGFTKTENQNAWDDSLFRKELEEYFPPEFLGRMNHIIRCHPLDTTMSRQIMDIHLQKINYSLSAYYGGNMMVEVTPAYQNNFLETRKSDIWKEGWRPLVRHMNTIAEQVGFAIHNEAETLGAWFGWGKMVFDIDDRGTPSIRLIRANTRTQLLQILPEAWRKDMVSQTIDTVFRENRKMIETYMRLITQYDTGFYDAVRELEHRLIERLWFTEEQIKQLRIGSFLDFHDALIRPTSAYEQVTENIGTFPDSSIRMIRSTIAWFVRQGTSPWTIYEWLYNFIERPLTPPELQFVWYYILQQEMLRHARS